MKIKKADLENIIREEILKSKLKMPLLESAGPKKSISENIIMKIIEESDDIQFGLSSKQLSLKEAVNLASLRYANLLHDELLESLLNEEFVQEVKQKIEVLK